jgi:hypothetical protein
MKEFMPGVLRQPPSIVDRIAGPGYRAVWVIPNDTALLFPLRTAEVL